MEQEEIKKVILNYNNLVKLAKEKISILETIDEMYNTYRGIESISFYTYEEDSVHVICDDSCMGCYDSISFSFPTLFLTLSDNDLRSTVQDQKVKRIEQERLKKEQERIEKENIKEKRELDEYNRLKEKYQS